MTKNGRTTLQNSSSKAAETPRASLQLIKKINDKKAAIGVIGLGYVGLPLLIAFCKAGFKVTGFDISKSKVESLNAGKRYIRHIDISSLDGNPHFSLDCKVGVLCT